jgi:hypothetical protein
MYRAAQFLHRHAKEVMDAWGVVIGEHREELANRTLPEDGLLRLYLADTDRQRRQIRRQGPSNPSRRRSGHRD